MSDRETVETVSVAARLAFLEERAAQEPETLSREHPFLTRGAELLASLLRLGATQGESNQVLGL